MEIIEVVIVFIDEFVCWLEVEVGNKIGFLGIGKDNYIWYL